MAAIAGRRCEGAARAATVSWARRVEPGVCLRAAQHVRRQPVATSIDAFGSLTHVDASAALQALGTSAAMKKTVVPTSVAPLQNLYTVPLFTMDAAKHHKVCSLNLPAPTPIVCLHGLLGSGRNLQAWASLLGKRLGNDRRVLLADLRNHGQSAHADSMSYPQMAADVVRMMQMQGIEKAKLVGHSMGGKVAAAVALLCPERVESLVLLDIAPVAYTGAVESTKVWGDKYLDILSAMSALPVEQMKDRRDAQRYLAEYLIDSPPWLRTFALTNLVACSDSGGMRWRVNLDVLHDNWQGLRGFDLGSCEHSLRYHGPTLFARGERSNYVNDEHKERMRLLFPDSEIATIANTSHFLHTEDPDTVADVVAQFLA
eukprot:TRINITY_DN101020_c0_g1_i1.p1 TRINITY_DN101020_c0_g1~~TRINITY_DN101020_c0_g1_i1.p1  ORF type:complete len:372 (-),score=48.11 TRINITY_DN101020_c0_g1_i1:161-1276(-)